MNIQELRDRYGLKTRQSIYSWCKAANITLAKDEKNRNYATPEQIAIFDQLSQHLADGGTLKNFSPALTTTIETVNLSTR